MRISDWSSDGALPIFPHAVRTYGPESWLIMGKTPCGSIRRDTDWRESRRLGQGPPSVQRIEGSISFLPSKTGILQIGRASCRERMGQYVLILVVAVTFKQTKNIKKLR